MMIAFNQMYRGMGDQGFAILAGESFWEFCFCVLNATLQATLQGNWVVGVVWRARFSLFEGPS